MTELETASGLSLLCRVGGCVCALPAEHVVETMRPLPIEPLRGAPRFIAGASVVRGLALPVVLATRLLANEDDTSVPERFVVIRAGARRAVLAVDEVLGVRRVAATEASATSPLLERAADGAIETIATLDAELLLVLRASRLVPESVWAALAVEASG